MDDLLASIAGFHDSMAKEIHIMNRGYVDQEHAMSMTHQFDAQILIQSQWSPFAIELVFLKVLEINISDCTDYWDASGSIEHITAPIEKDLVRMSFDSSLVISAEQMFYRVRSEWLGKEAFLKTEVPSTEALAASVVQDKWRQCSGCSDAWEASQEEQFSICPNCGSLTELLN